MNYERLGSSGLMVPEIGLGTWRYTGGPEPLRRGVELGANLIDTAEMYRTEAAVGEAIAGIRDQVIVATKVLGSHLRYDEVLKAAEQSLRYAGRGPHRPVPDPLAEPEGAHCRNDARHGPAGIRWRGGIRGRQQFLR